MTAPFDPGLQLERTELAWRRTTLAMGLGSLVAVRLLPAALGNAWWVLIGLFGLLITAVIWVHRRRRMQEVHTVLAREGDRGRMPGAMPLAGLSLFVLATGCLVTVIVLLTETRVRF